MKPRHRLQIIFIKKFNCHLRSVQCISVLDPGHNKDRSIHYRRINFSFSVYFLNNSKKTPNFYCRFSWKWTCICLMGESIRNMRLGHWGSNVGRIVHLPLSRMSNLIIYVVPLIALVLAWRFWCGSRITVGVLRRHGKPRLGWLYRKCLREINNCSLYQLYTNG